MLIKSGVPVAHVCAHVIFDGMRSSREFEPVGPGSESRIAMYLADVTSITSRPLWTVTQAYLKPTCGLTQGDLCLACVTN